VLLIAGKLSGTFQSAQIAKEMSDYADIHIVDSLSAITGLRLLVEHAVELRDKGVGLIEIVKKMEDMKERIVLLAMVDTLEYLYKGGRLSRSSAIIGSLLKFKPIINVKDGVIGVVGKERGTNKGIARMLSAIDEFGAIDKQYPVNLGYTAESSITEQFKEKLLEKYHLTNTPMYPVGCVVGTHVGPGACVIIYIKKK
jgi:DegV family protein with EDD domain